MLLDRVGQAAGEGDAAALDPDEDEAVGAGLLLDDLVGDADDRPADLVRGHDACGRSSGERRRGAVSHAAGSSFPASRDRSLKGRREGYRS